MAKKLSLGRQKIEMTKIKKKTHLQVTFSKRRSGLFKKASELCTLCGVEICILVFSPAGKAFSFGHPNVESIMSKFLTRKIRTDSSEPVLVEAYQSINVRELNLELNLELTHVLKDVENEKKQGEFLTQIRKAGQAQCWWEKPIDELGFHELGMLKSSIEDLKKNVENLSIERARSSAFFMNNHFERKFPSDQIMNATIPHGYNFGFANMF